jgi:hypothetical protein
MIAKDQASYVQRTVDGLSISQRNVLIQHIDGPVDVDLTDPKRRKSWRSLVDLKLLKSDGLEPAIAPLFRPRRCVLSWNGRQVVAKILADYADALVRAGCLRGEFLAETPLQILQRLRAARKPIPAPPAPERALKPL